MRLAVIACLLPVACFGWGLHFGQSPTNFVTERQLGAELILPFTTGDTTTTADYSGNGYNGTSTNAITITDGGLVLTSDEMVSIDSTLNLQSNVTINVWLKIPSGDHPEVFFKKTGVWALRAVNAGQIRFYFYGTKVPTNFCYSGFAFPTPDVWNMMTIRNNGKTTYSYVNTDYVSQRYGAGAFIFSTNSFVLGGGDSGTMIDDVQIFDHYLTNGECDELYKKGRTTNDTFPGGWDTEPALFPRLDAVSNVHTGTVYTTNLDQRISTTGTYDNDDYTLKIAKCDDRAYGISYDVSGAATNDARAVYRAYDGAAAVTVTSSVYGLSYTIERDLAATFSGDTTSYIDGVPGSAREDCTWTITGSTNRLDGSHWNANGILTNTSFKTLSTSCSAGTTLIAADIGISAYHCAPTTGTECVFRDAAYNEVVLTVDDYRDIPGENIRIVKFSTETTIPPVPVMPADWADYFPNGFDRIPLVALFGTWQTILDGTATGGGTQVPIYADRLERYFSFALTGSGASKHLVFDGVPVLESIVRNSGGGSWYTIGDVDVLIADMGGTNFPSRFDLSGFGLF